jgi:predicted  nucleic acid-binding Zn-ribbon protein
MDMMKMGKMNMGCNAEGAKMNSVTAMQAMETVLSSIRQVGSQMTALKAKIHLYNNALDNARHDREFGDYTEDEILAHDRKVNGISKRRRVVKDELLLLIAFKDMYDNNKGIRETLQRAVNSMEGAKRRVGSQRYTAKETGGVEDEL